MESELGGGPMLPLGALLPITAFSLLVLLIQLRRVEGAAVRFALAAIWIRFITGLYHPFTFPKIVGPLSINALITGVVVIAGFLCIPRRLLLLRWMLPFYLLTAVYLLSALLSGSVGSSINALLKCGYLIVLIVAVYQATLVNGVQRTTSAILWVMMPLLLFVAASLVLGVVKGSDEDGSSSYIGGYAHEAAWSVMLLTLFFAVAMTRFRLQGLRFALLAATTVAIVLANYRTTMLAIVPLLVFELLFKPLSRLVPAQRVLIGCISIFVVLCAGLFVVDNLGARFTDFASLVNNPPDLTDASGLSYSESRLFSGRIGIWAAYIDAYFNSSPLQHLIGYGPDAWQGVMLVYAHNSFVSALYEVGIVGLVSLIVVFAAMFALAARARAQRMRLLVGYTSFLILNLATMPLYQLEGNILLAILYGITCAYSLRTSGAPLASQAAPPVRMPVWLGRPRAARSGS